MILFKPLVSHGCFSTFTLVAMLVLFATSAHSAQVGGHFNVTVNLQNRVSPAPTSIFCRSSPALAFGAVLTVVCSTGAVVDVSANPNAIPYAPLNGNSYRYIMHDTAGYIDSIDDFSSLGTVTTWRMIDLADRDYLEVLVGW